jgi:hypothetical protein
LFILLTLLNLSNCQQHVQRGFPVSLKSRATGIRQFTNAISKLRLNMLRGIHFKLVFQIGVYTYIVGPTLTIRAQTLCMLSALVAGYVCVYVNSTLCILSDVDAG